MDDTENVTGKIIEVRGPFQDDSYELDIEQEDGEVVTVAIELDHYEELLASQYPHLRLVN